MNKEEEKEYWARLVRETQRLSGLTLDQLGDKVGACSREVSYWKAGEKRPTGMTAVRFFEFRRELLFKAGLLDMAGFFILRTTVRSQVSGDSILS